MKISYPLFHLKFIPYAILIILTVHFHSLVSNRKLYAETESKENITIGKQNSGINSVEPPVTEEISKNNLLLNPESDTNNPNTSSNDKSVWALIVKGGWTMLGLGLISAIILGFILERFYLFKRKNISTRGYYEFINNTLLDKDIGKDLTLLNSELKKDNRLLSVIISSGIELEINNTQNIPRAIESVASSEFGILERGLNLLSGMGNLAPLLGFFGTVVGMRNSFLQFVEKAAPTAQDLAGGVEEALITTAAGLLIAIPTYLIHNLFIYAIDSLGIELERATASISKHFKIQLK